MTHQETSLHLTQGLSLSPKALQSIEFLQLASLELVSRIEEALEHNEALELVRPAGEPMPADDSRGVRNSNPAASDGGSDWTADVVDRGPGLVALVRSQLRAAGLGEDIERAAIRLLEALDPSGFLSEGRDELRAALGGDLFDAGLTALGDCEPQGLGAAGPIDALLGRLDQNDPDRELVEIVLTEYLDDLAEERLGEVADAVGLDEGELDALLDRVRGLEIRPADVVESAERAPSVCDLMVERDPLGRFVVRVADFSVPVLRVDESYTSMVEDATTAAPVRRYLRPKIKAARDLVAAVEQRQETLARVGSAIFEEQAPFLRDGFEAVRPLTMDVIAERVSLHPSTVSRAVAGKWVGTPHGAVPLRRFFDGGRLADGVAGRQGVLARLRSLIDSEDPADPLSDEQLRELLGRQGIPLARRTVAKYRSQLGLGTSSVRARRSTRARRRSSLD
ncbi:MAG: RNA polymerase factor sigma-54 [Planctomycetota bacterium]